MGSLNEKVPKENRNKQQKKYNSKIKLKKIV